MEQQHVRSDRVPMIRSGGAKHYQPCISLIRKNLCISWVSSLVRLGVVVIVFAWRSVLLVDNVWGFLFYMLLALIDIISLIGEINTYQFLRKEEKTLQNIDEQRRQGVTVTERVRVGDYNTYLSPYEIIYRYKFGYKPTASSYTIIRYLHTITTFALFGALGLKECKKVEQALPEAIVLALVILSVYVVNFELDYMTLETAKGKYQEIQSLSEGVKQQIVKKFRMWRRVVAGIYIAVFLLLVTALVLAICLEPISQIIGLIVVLNLSIAIVACNIGYQYYLTRQPGKLAERIAFPLYTDKVSNPSHLLFELKSAYPRLFVFLNTGMRTTLFCLFLATMYNAVVLLESTLYVLLGCILIIASAQIVKLTIGHRMRIDYFRPVQLTTEKRVSMTCSICLSNYVENTIQVELPCSQQHTFHKSCLENWMKSKKECPLCRYDLGQFMK